MNPPLICLVDWLTHVSGSHWQRHFLEKHRRFLKERQEEDAQCSQDVRHEDAERDHYEHEAKC